MRAWIGHRKYLKFYLKPKQTKVLYSRLPDAEHMLGLRTQYDEDEPLLLSTGLSFVQWDLSLFLQSASMQKHDILFWTNNTFYLQGTQDRVYQDQKGMVAALRPAPYVQYQSSTPTGIYYFKKARYFFDLLSLGASWDTASLFAHAKEKELTVKAFPVAGWVPFYDENVMKTYKYWQDIF